MALASIVSLTLTAATAQPAPPAEIMARVEAARSAVRKHSEDLRFGLREALKAGGPKAAIGACTSLAPEVDGKAGEQTGFEIGRTALKLRNPENLPDNWERDALESFVSQIGAGANPKTLEAFDIQTTNVGQKLFRYMKPIFMTEVCLACHGPNVTQDVKAEIARTYTDDKATGFNLGDLRGAFTLTQVLE